MHAAGVHGNSLFSEIFWKRKIVWVNPFSCAILCPKDYNLALSPSGFRWLFLFRFFSLYHPSSHLNHINVSNTVRWALCWIKTKGRCMFCRESTADRTATRGRGAERRGSATVRGSIREENDWDREEADKRRVETWPGIEVGQREWESSGRDKDKHCPCGKGIANFTTGRPV